MSAPADLRAYETYYGCCSWVFNGKRCHYAGTVRYGINEKGDWFCYAHAQTPTMEEGAKIVTKSHSDVPSPDYSYEARRRAFLSRANRL